LSRLFLNILHYIAFARFAATPPLPPVERRQPAAIFAASPLPLLLASLKESQVVEGFQILFIDNTFHDIASLRFIISQPAFTSIVSMDAVITIADFSLSLLLHFSINA